MDAEIAKLVSNALMPESVKPDLSKSFDSIMSASKQPMDIDIADTDNMDLDRMHIDAFENGDQMGLYKPVAPEVTGDNNTSLLGKFIETNDIQLSNNAKEVKSLKDQISQPGISLEQKAESLMEMSGKIANSAFQVAGGSAIGNGVKKDVETVMRNQ